MELPTPLFLLTPALQYLTHIEAEMLQLEQGQEAWSSNLAGSYSTLSLLIIPEVFVAHNLKPPLQRLEHELLGYIALPACLLAFSF